MNRDKKNQAVSLLLEYRQEMIVEVETIDKAIRAMSENEAPSLIEKQMSKTPDNVNIWLNMTVQEAVLEFLGRHPERAYRASEIKRFLKRQKVPGFDKKSFAAMVATSVRRIAKKDNAVQTTVNIRNRKVAAFKYKNENY